MLSESTASCLPPGETSNPDIDYTLADVYEAAGHYQEALDVIDQLIATGFDSEPSYLRKGGLETHLKRYREAKESFERALDKAPQSVDAQNALAAISGFLGEGANTSIKDVIEPVPLPEELTQTAATDTKSISSEDYEAVFLRRIRAMEFRRRDLTRQTDYISIKVLDDSGVERFSIIEQSYDPLYEDLYVNRLEVYDADDNLVATGDVADYYVIDDTRSGIASQDKLLQIPVPGLQPGYRIELIVSRRELRPAEAFPFTEYLFSRSLPVGRSALVVLGDAKSFKWRGSAEIVLSECLGGIYFEQVNPPVYRGEPLQDHIFRFLPHVSLGDAMATWKDTGTSYLKDIEDRLALDEAARELALEQVGSLEEDREKVLALARYVRNTLTYQSIEFGRRARIMNEFSQIVRDKYGDCKDHSLLLYQLLRSIGIPAQLALVNTVGPIEKDLPSFDQFDHMIVYVPQVDDGRFIDCTIENVSMASAVPYGLNEKSAFILEAETPRFVEIPPYRQLQPTVISSRSVHIIGSTTFLVREKLTLHAYSAGLWRSYLKAFPAASRKPRLQSLVAEGNSGLRLQKLRIENLQDTEKPLILDLEYTVQNGLHEVERRLIGNLPAVWEQYYVSSDYMDQRLTPFRLEMPLYLRSQLELHVPEELEFVSLRKPPGKDTNRFLAWKTNLKRTDDGAVLLFAIRRPASRHPAESYGSYHEATRAAQRAYSPSLVLKPRGSE